MPKAFKAIGCLLTLVLLILCSACSDPPVDSVTIQDPQRYLEVNEFVSHYLESNFVGALPAEAQVDVENAEYDYRYVCAILGDPNFLIHLRNPYASTEDYEAELERLSGIATRKITTQEDKVLYVIKLSETVEKYYDDGQVYDGVPFLFEVAIADSGTETIEYLSAVLQDNFERYEYIDKIVDTIIRQGIRQGTVLCVDETGG